MGVLREKNDGEKNGRWQQIICKQIVDNKNKKKRLFRQSNSNAYFSLFQNQTDDILKSILAEFDRSLILINTYD